MILYGNHESGHSFKVRSFLQLTNTPHEYRWVDLTQPLAQRRADFIAHSQFGEVPVLLDGDKVLCQSNSILMYLAQKTQQLCGTPAEWTHITEWLSWETNRIGFSVPNLRYALHWDAQPPDVLDYLRRRAVADLTTLNCFLADSPFLLKSGLTIADVSCSGYLFWLEQAGLSADEFPHVKRWLNGIRQSAGWQHPDISLKSAATP